MSTENPFYIVGIGASAGGLEALDAFFSNVPVDGGLAFVVIQHLSPDYKSLMVELLSKRTQMQLHQAQDGMEVLPNNAYLIPPNQNMTISNGKLQLTERNKSEMRLNLPIDLFLHSLAEDIGEKAIGIILSGTGSDGTSGIRSIKEVGGMVMAHDGSARFDGMPRSAIGTQLVDYILPPDKMPSALINYIQHPGLGILHTDLEKVALGQSVSGRYEDTMNKIFIIVRDQTKVDFSQYKPSTMTRRIERRMSINQIDDLQSYLTYLHQSSSEVRTLFKELLIGVTKFHRDRDAFTILREKIVPDIVAGKTNQESVRVWIAGCSTGEEAYSIAMLFMDEMEGRGRRIDVKIFATDIDREALEKASRAIYPESIAADVDGQYLSRYFIKRGDSYEIVPRIREMVIFAQQNIVIDPPFSKTDLVSCRNVLIYFRPTLQKKALANFEFSLKPGGYLFLGSSETTPDSGQFTVYDSKWKMYRKPENATGKRPSSLAALSSFTMPSSQTATPTRGTTANNRRTEHLFKQLVDELLPPCVVINRDYHILHAFGDLRSFLQMPTGYNISLNLMDMLHPDMSVTVGTAVHKVYKDGQEVWYKNVGVPREDAPLRKMSIRARPIHQPSGARDMVLIVFDERMEMQRPQEGSDTQMFDINETTEQRIVDLEQELKYTRESLRATIEELETANEELQATNEELLAANEELQSTNEELQSVNEELITVNAEYQAKIQELVELNDDLNNVFSITNAGTIFLDEMLSVRRFTPSVQSNVNLLDQDMGRPFSHISHRLEGVDLLTICHSVLDTLIPDEREIQNGDGEWFLLRVVPYRTANNAIRGVVLTLVDITQVKQAQRRLEERDILVQALTERAEALEDQLRPIDILLIEDDFALVQLLKKLHFPQLGIQYNLHPVFDGAAALDFIQKRAGHTNAPTPDLIISDLNLPDINGRDVVTKIKENERLAQIPVIIMTSDHGDAPMKDAMEMDSVAFLRKPFDPDAFRRAIRSAFDSHDFVIIRG